MGVLSPNMLGSLWGFQKGKSLLLEVPHQEKASGFRGPPPVEVKATTQVCLGGPLPPFILHTSDPQDKTSSANRVPSLGSSDVPFKVPQGMEPRPCLPLCNRGKSLRFRGEYLKKLLRCHEQEKVCIRCQAKSRN